MQDNILQNNTDTSATSISTAPKAPRDTSMYASIAFLVTMICTSIGLWIYTDYAQTPQIQQIQYATSTANSSISKLEKDKLLSIGIVLRDEKNVPISLPVSALVKSFKTAAESAGVAFDGFNIANGRIKTKLTATNMYGTTGDPANTIVKMIRTYNTDTSIGWALNPILAIDGDPTSRSSDIEFELVQKKK